MTPGSQEPLSQAYLEHVVHELRNPLAALRFGIQLLRGSMEDPAAIHRIVEQLDRQLEDLSQQLDDVLSQEPAGQGSVVPRPLSFAAPSTAEPTANVTPRRVLVVDDQVDAAESLSALLRLAGHEVQVAHTGREALATAVAFQPHCVILDIGLPELDGLKVARALRSSGAPMPSLLMALSGYPKPPDWELGAGADFDHYLVKPADPDVIQYLVDHSPLN